MSIIIILLLTVVILTLVMLASIWQINAAAKLMVGTKHHDMEYIINTGKVPQSWSKPFEKKIAKLKRRANSQMEILELKEKANEDYMHKLSKLIDYAKTTKLVDSEETRQILVESLDVVFNEWKEKNERGWLLGE
ncbi:hypothetical protein [Mahella australiensis]|uniref:Uncharacterized protein n=1 Tax=Mahella australiensis (strain DSM 15567 / CIP 107919 / 50-1 BON) TaxID=697281 RepID=F3ZW19_MAHA5|nr:hypothetical protein [Mahella australiensis]AEE96399.1 hypothetical protein Mahau_1203 [Mahella australiensis 50-1 BON]